LEWKSLKKQKLKNGDYVLVYNDYCKVICEDFWIGDEDSVDGVTHWMLVDEIPNPLKDDEEERFGGPPPESMKEFLKEKFIRR
jgi:hypothetical protein